MKQIAKNITTVRETMGMSQRELADAIPASEATVSLLESGKRLPSLAMLVSIKRALGCAWPALLRGVE